MSQLEQDVYELLKRKLRKEMNVKQYCKEFVEESLYSGINDELEKGAIVKHVIRTIHSVDKTYFLVVFEKYE